MFMASKESKESYLEQIRKKEIFKETMELKEFLEYAFLLIRPKMGAMKGSSFQIWHNSSINKNSIPKIIEVASAVGVKYFDYGGQTIAVNELAKAKSLRKGFPEKELNPLKKYRRKILNAPEIFENKYKEIKKNLHTKKESKYTLVLGAGLSNSVGIPDWKKLVEALASDFLTDKINKDLNKLSGKDKISKCKPSNYTNLLVYARVISNFNEKKIPHNKEHDFKTAIAKKIYENNDYDISRTTMDAVIQFVGENREKIDSVITYNYDDTLEYHLAHSGIDCKAIYVNEEGRPECESYGSHVGDGGIPIYHVHGLIKISEIENGTDKECYKAVKSNIILTELDYHKEYSALLGFNTQIQIEKFKNTNCIFLGISLTDPNLRRVLDYADNLTVGTRFLKYWVEKNVYGNLIFGHFDKINNLEFRYKQLSAEFIQEELTNLTKEEIAAKIKKFYTDYEMELNKIPDYLDIKNNDNSLEKLILKTIDCVSFGIIPVYLADYDSDNYFQNLAHILKS